MLDGDCACGEREEALRAPGPVQRLEEGGVGERERVRRPVRGGRQGDPAGRHRLEERAQIVRLDAREVGVHDEHRADRLEPPERRLDRGALSSWDAPEHVNLEFRRHAPGRLVVRDDSGGRDRGGRGEHVGEHREAERDARLRRRRCEAPLALGASERNQDGRHPGRLSPL